MFLTAHLGNDKSKKQEIRIMINVRGGNSRCTPLSLYSNSIGPSSLKYNLMSRVRNDLNPYSTLGEREGGRRGVIPTLELA